MSSWKSNSEPLVLVRYKDIAELQTVDGRILEHFNDDQIHFFVNEYFEDYVVAEEGYEYMDRSRRYLLKESP